VQEAPELSAYGRFTAQRAHPVLKDKTIRKRHAGLGSIHSPSSLPPARSVRALTCRDESGASNRSDLVCPVSRTNARRAQASSTLLGH